MRDRPSTFVLDMSRKVLSVSDVILFVDQDLVISLWPKFTLDYFSSCKKLIFNGLFDGMYFIFCLCKDMQINGLDATNFYTFAAVLTVTLENKLIFHNYCNRYVFTLRN